MKTVEGWPLAVDPKVLDGSKVQRSYVDHSCGFSVKLLNVPMVKARGVWTLNVNPNYLLRVVLRALASKPTRLTGAEIRFVRLSADLTQALFAKRFDVSNVAVHKWEQEGAESPAIKWPFEREIRLFIYDLMKADDKTLGALYRALEKPAKPNSGKLLVAQAIGKVDPPLRAAG